MTTITNPILRGFNPDPSILRVGQDYYIATSTFEWFPGVRIHHSRDLVHWTLITHPLRRVSQLDMRGNPDSCGVWAPCLTYCGGIFYLVYTNVRSFDGPWKDTPNYLVTSDHITGDWSDPIFLNASGFDPSLFHDDDGRKWLLNMYMDHRGGKFFGGIVLQEYDSKSQKLIGPIHHIFEGTQLGCTEGPHLYKKDGYYYLITAEGGTEYAHAITVCRSKSITGPYQLHPQNPIVTVYHKPEHPLQKSGHGDFVQNEDGQWLAAFLVSRPLTTRGRCITGRETALERITWRDGWPYLDHDEKTPRVQVDMPELSLHPIAETPKRDEFNHPQLDLEWQALRVPITDDWASIKARPGCLRLTGRESLSSLNRQSLIARRITEHHTTAACEMEFNPTTFQQMAGLVCYYNSYHYHYLYQTADDQGQPILSIISCDKYNITEPLKQAIPIPKGKPIQLKADYMGKNLQFYYATEPDQWQTIGPTLDGSILSDDYVCDQSVRYRPAFTGAFIGLCCQDLSGSGIYADFHWFEYNPCPEETS